MHFLESMTRTKILFESLKFKVIVPLIISTLLTHLAIHILFVLVMALDFRVPLYKIFDNGLHFCHVMFEILLQLELKILIFKSCFFISILHF